MKTENFYSILFLLTSIFLFFFFTYPKQKSLSSLNKKLSETKYEFETLDKYFDEINKNSKKLKDYNEEILKIDSALPDDPSFPTIFNFFQKYSSQTGLLLEGISSPTFVEQENLKRWTTNLKLSGSYSSLKNFISILETSSRIIEIDKISLSAGKESLSINLTLSFFSY
jgi:Tfp pilus assembly protein PilO